MVPVRNFIWGSQGEALSELQRQPIGTQSTRGIEERATRHRDTVNRVLEWAETGESRYICRGVPAATGAGPDLIAAVLEAAERSGLQVGLYGGSPECLQQLTEKADKDYPGFVGYRFSPPLRGLSDAEDQMIVDRINASGIQILFVGLGCPEEEQWMTVHEHRVYAVMVGAGAQFEALTCRGLLAQDQRRPEPRRPFHRFTERGRVWRRSIDY